MTESQPNSPIDPAVLETAHRCAVLSQLCYLPEREIRRLFDFLGQPIADAVFAPFNHPSPLTQPESAIVTGKDPLNAWRHEVSPQQLRRAVTLLGYLGLDNIYGQDSLPNSQAVARMLEDNALR